MGLDAFVEQRRQNFREVRLALEKRQADKEKERARANALIKRPSAGTSMNVGDLVMVKESDSALHRDGKGKLQHERYTGPWEIQEVLTTGLSAKVMMRGRRPRTRTVAASEVKPVHVRPAHLRHSIADEFAQYIWGPDWKTPNSPDADPVFVTLTDRREISSATGTKYWEYRARTAEGKVSEWLPESGLGGSFTLHELDAFHALFNLYHPPAPKATTAKPKTRLSHADALGLFPLGTVVWRVFDETEVKGQVYDYTGRYWRVRYPDHDWEEFSRRELENFKRNGKLELPAPQQSLENS